SISGLTRPVTLTLRNETLTITSDGNFSFSGPIEDGSSVTLHAGISMYQICNDVSFLINGSNISDLAVQCRGVTYFNGDDGVNGPELWRTDGTTDGTYMVKNLDGINLNTTLEYWAFDDSTLYFTDLSTLWKTDGTSDGTQVVAGQASGLTLLKDFIVYNGDLYFVATNATSGREIYKSDGTAQGTALLKETAAGITSLNPHSLTQHNGLIYFIADASPGQGAAIWRSDGTETGTVQAVHLTDRTEFDRLPFLLTSAAGKLYMTFGVVTNDLELAITDGTQAGTEFIDLNSSGASLPLDFYEFNGKVYFSADGTSSNNTNQELWVSDGTAAGTRLLKEINPADSSNVAEFQSFNGFLYFRADNGVSGTELWRSDGTPDGTVLFKDIYPDAGTSFPRAFTLAGDRMYFSATDGTNGNAYELWITDGTAEGTQLVKNTDQSQIHQGPGSLVDYLYENTSTSHHFFWAGGRTIVYSGTDGSYMGGYSGYEVWRSDGTASGTVMVKDINPTGDDVYDPDGNYSSL
ncbi:MAG: hypothetical protein OEX00_01590, partial [Gammaproteobacteria bacterium]|nr:hypothetical protein [Gammaproteobacteria bacterium]